MCVCVDEREGDRGYEREYGEDGKVDDSGPFIIYAGDWVEGG